MGLVLSLLLKWCFMDGSELFWISSTETRDWNCIFCSPQFLAVVPSLSPIVTDHTRDYCCNGFQ